MRDGTTGVNTLWCGRDHKRSSGRSKDGRIEVEARIEELKTLAQDANIGEEMEVEDADAEELGVLVVLPELELTEDSDFVTVNFCD